MVVNLKDKSKKYEKIILAFMLKDTKYIDRIVGHIGIGRIKDFFSNKDCEYVFDLIYNYKIMFGNIIVKKTFEDFIDNACTRNEIESSDRVRYAELFDEIWLEKDSLEDPQFDPIRYEWMQIEIAPKFLEKIREEKNNLDLCKVFQVFANIEREINKYKSLMKTDDGLKVIFLNDYMPILKSKFNKSISGDEEEDDGVPSGISSLDRYLVRGFAKGKLSLIGGRSSSGKTTLALNIGTNMMLKKKRVIFVSLEMDEDEVYNAIVSRLSKIPYYRLASPRKNKGDKEEEKYTKVINMVYDKIRNDFCVLKGNAGTYTWEEIQSMIENEIFTKEWIPDCIIIDYLALIALPKNGQRRDIALGDLAKKIRAFAEKTNIALITLVQANRSSITKDPKTGKDIVDIKIENIEDSNKIGQDADLFLTINQIVNGDNSIKYDVWIKKQRGGERERLIELKSDMRYQWIMDEDGVYNEPYVLGENPTKEERELYAEVIRIEKKESAKIETGIDEDETIVSKDDFKINKVEINNNNNNNDDDDDDDERERINNESIVDIEELINASDCFVNDNKEEKVENYFFTKKEINSFSLDGYDSYE